MPSSSPKQDLLLTPPPPGGRAGEHPPGRNGGRGPARVSLRSRYIDVTDFVLPEVRPKYQDAGVPCTDATVAAIAATLFIAACRTEGARPSMRLKGR